MENKVKISKDGSTIDFAQADKVPVSPKKFRQGPELEGFYRFIFENDLRREAMQVIDRVYLARKAIKMKKPLEALRKAKIAAQEALQSAIVSSAKKAVAPKITTKAAQKAKVAAPKVASAKKAAAPKTTKATKKVTAAKIAAPKAKATAKKAKAPAKAKKTSAAKKSKKK